jgi:hypothetical protein
MAGVVEDLQAGRGPSPGQPPRGDQWPADIEASVDEQARDPVQPRGIPDQLVLREKRGMSPLVSDEPSKP